MDTYFGCLWTTTNPGYNPFNGYIDDARYYNYALSPAEITQIYVDGTGIPQCVSELQFDTNDDCVVNFEDFAKFAAEWMQDAWIYPSN